MKRLLLASAAAIALFAPGTSLRAADMAVKAPPLPYVPPPFNWTGFYVGGNIGAGAVTGTLFDSAGVGIVDVGGRAEFIGGGQIGYNWQFSPNWVFGVEWFFDGIASNNNGGIVVSPVTGDLLAGSARADWVTTITGRIGITGPTADHWMWYTKGGWGWVNTQGTVADLTVPASVSFSNTTGGWVWGTGVEWAFAQNWTLKVEYQFIGLDNVSVGGVLRDSLSVQNANFQSVTLGINYLFNWGQQLAGPPVVSRY
jgi:outer membrane immunogenic protein